MRHVSPSVSFSAALPSEKACAPRPRHEPCCKPIRIPPPGKTICGLAGLAAVSLSALPLRSVPPCLAAICCGLPGSLLSCLTWQPVPRSAPWASAQLSPLSSFDLPLPEIHSSPVPSPSGGLAGGVALPLVIPAALSRPSKARYVNPPVYNLYVNISIEANRRADQRWRLAESRGFGTGMGLSREGRQRRRREGDGEGVTPHT